MNEAVRCGVCCEVYCEGTREPRMLPCGHTFCRSCLDVNQSKCGGGHLTCLTCPTKHQVSLQHLPISFALLDLATNYNDSQPEWCSVHGDGLNYWCRECKRLLCGLCLYTGHPLGHQVTPARALLHKKRAITSQLANINCIVEKVKQHTVAIFHDTVSQILSLSRWTGRITEVEAKVAALTAQQDDITGVEAVEDYEHKVKRLAEEAEDIVTSFTTVRTKTRNGVNDGGKSGGGGGGENGGDSGNNSDVNGGGGDIRW
ncbi:tripartite motif-containing protein 59-like [Homarus americanus]|uniref:tripartite motif-containing protein 59-like n=1 Tax=Homarus americanus TaxID=6706 RepID=UPI001C47AB25|nr:tripartite motif-containing protein 59-like [Homarus americanus]